MIKVQVTGIKDTDTMLTNIISNLKSGGPGVAQEAARRIVRYGRINIESNRKFTEGPSDVADTIRSYKVGPNSYAVEVFHPAALAIEEGRRAIIYPETRTIYLRGIGFRTFGPNNPIGSTKPKWFMRNAIRQTRNEIDEIIEERLKLNKR